MSTVLAKGRNENDLTIEAAIVAAIDAAASVRPEAIVLFGSRARGDHRPDSDWDVLVLLPDDMANIGADRVAIDEAVMPFFEQLGAPVRPLVLRWSEIDRNEGLFNAILQDGKPIA